MTPKIEILASRNAVCRDVPTDLILLVRITAPRSTTEVARPPLNIGLVLDESGSMAGEKLTQATAAAEFLIQQLLPTDRVSVTLFEQQVRTLISSTLATEKAQLIDTIRRNYSPKGGTALHQGWVEGGLQVAKYLDSKAMNRVMLMTDGLANVGQSDPAAITADVKGLSARGVSTSTFGVGRDYNEYLLLAMAEAGDGNAFYIETPVQLADFFQTELNGLMHTIGRKVTLGLAPRSGAVITEVINNLARDEQNRLQLANLIEENPLEVVLKIRVPPQAEAAEVLEVAVGWEPPGSSERQTLLGSLRLQSVLAADFPVVPENREVLAQYVAQQMGRLKAEAGQAISEGNSDKAKAKLDEARALSSKAPEHEEVRTELAGLDQITRNVTDRGNASKMANYQAYKRRSSQR
jgi:Ca-activated chloride channel family protein